MNGEDKEVCYNSEEVAEAFAEWSVSHEAEIGEAYVLARKAFTAGMNEILVRIEDWSEWLKASQ